MIFDDGEEVIATLTSVTTDMDESRHLIYENVERSTRPRGFPDTTTYSPGEALVRCLALDSEG